MKFSREQIEWAVEQSNTVKGAAIKLGIESRTFKRHALKFNLYKPRTAAQNGTTKNGSGLRRSTNDILNGLHPDYCTTHLSKRLIKEGIKSYSCEGKNSDGVICGLSEWHGKRISLELNHINGSNSDHRLENLELLCPNCHSITDTFRFKNKSHGTRTRSGLGTDLKSAQP